MNHEPIEEFMKLNEQQIERYSRHIILPEVGGVGQEKILQSKVLILGTGALGSPVALYLASAGVGKLGIVDCDKVDLSNLQRQIIHNMDDIGKDKTASAVAKINKINPDVEVLTLQTRVNSKNIMQIIKDYDLVVDGTDNFPTRFLVNDACYFAKKPLIHGAILRFEGQVTTIISNENGPCYRCLYAEPPPEGLVPNCSQAGIIGSVSGIVGSIQASEALKIILGKGNTLKGRLLAINVMEMKFSEVKMRKDPSCPLCGQNPTIKELVDYQQACTL